ncbi:MAG: class I SAM-dependent methyltransferase [Planctomycetota bacterium]|jgi:hypothetical protein
MHQEPRQFPDLQEWSTKVVHPRDEEKFRTEKFWGMYLAKYRIARDLAPDSICEIGVRYGYSAWAFLCAAPTASYRGLDAQTGAHGGIKGENTFLYVTGLIGRDYPQCAATFVTIDTRRIRSVLETGGIAYSDADGDRQVRFVNPANQFDLIHVDGDHSEAACIHDLEMGLAACKPGGLVVIDDYDYIGGVKRAADAVRLTASAYIDRVLYVETLRGDCLFVRNDRPWPSEE